MSYSDFFPIMGFLISLSSTLVYLRQMFKGKAYPNRATSFLWALPPFIATAAALSKGAGWSVLPVLAEGLAPLSILFASFYKPHHVWRLGPFEWICAGLTLLSLFFWQRTGDANLAAALAVLSDVAAGLPVLRKAWLAPYSESAFSYALSALSFTTCFFALRTHTFAELAFPVYGEIYCLSLSSLLLIRRVLMPQNQTI